MKPRMLFIGVRISWLMVARNSVLARLVDRARRRASRADAALGRRGRVRKDDDLAALRAEWAVLVNEEAAARRATS